MADPTQWNRNESDNSDIDDVTETSTSVNRDIENFGEKSEVQPTYSDSFDFSKSSQPCEWKAIAESASSKHFRV